MSANRVRLVMPAVDSVEAVENPLHRAFKEIWTRIFDDGIGYARVVVDPYHSRGIGSGAVVDSFPSGVGGRVIPPVVVQDLSGVVGGGGGEYGVNAAVRYDMILASSDLTRVLELPVRFGNYLYNDRAAPGFITVREGLDDNSPRLVFDVRYRANKHRAYVTKKTWSGFAADHGLQAGDEISFEEHGDAFLLTAQRNGVALW